MVKKKYYRTTSAEPLVEIEEIPMTIHWDETIVSGGGDVM